MDLLLIVEYESKIFGYLAKLYGFLDGCLINNMS